MNRIAFVRTAALAGLLALGACRSATLSTAEEVLARNQAARGGIEAWRKVQTMAWSGHLESAHGPSGRLEFKLEQQRPNKTRLQINVGTEKSLRIFDGLQGWKVRAGRGRPDIQPYSPVEVKYARGGHGIDGPLLDAAAKGNRVSLVGIDEIGERKAYHLRVSLAKGGEEDVWVDARTHLEVRHDRMAEAPSGGLRRVSVLFGDYRSVEGLKIPFLIETGGGSPGGSPDRMLIEAVTLNVALEEGAFANPALPHFRARPGLANQDPAPGADRGAAPR